MASCGMMYFHPVTGEKNVAARTEMEISSVNLGKEYFHPVTGEPIEILPNQVSQRSQGVLASPLSIDSGSLCGLAEEYFHPVTGQDQ